MRADPHEILGIEQSASPERVRSRYRELARRYHPDANGGDATAAWVFKSINEAHHRVRQRQQHRSETASPATPNRSTAPNQETDSRRARADDCPKNDQRRARTGEDPLREASLTVIEALVVSAIAALASHMTGAGAVAGQWMGTTASTALWAIAGGTAFLSVLVISTWAAWREAGQESQ